MNWKFILTRATILASILLLESSSLSYALSDITSSIPQDQTVTELMTLFNEQKLTVNQLRNKVNELRMKQNNLEMELINCQAEIDNYKKMQKESEIQYQKLLEKCVQLKKDNQILKSRLMTLENLLSQIENYNGNNQQLLTEQANTLQLQSQLILQLENQINQLTDTLTRLTNEMQELKKSFEDYKKKVAHDKAIAKIQKIVIGISGLFGGYELGKHL